MASFSMHLAIAKLYLKTHPEEDTDEFIKGTLEPDLVPSIEKGRTHYGLHAAWSNPAKYLQENGKSIENSRKRGYFLHLVTDYLFYHKLIDIDKILSKQDLEYLANISKEQNTDISQGPNLSEWVKNQRNDFSVLEGEIRNRYDIENYIDFLPENIKKVMTSKEGELKVFERESLFGFLEDMAQIDLDKLSEELLKNPDADLIKLYEECHLHLNQGEFR